MRLSISDFSRKPILTGLLLIFCIVLFNNITIAQDGWYVNTNLQLAGGNFIYKTNSNTISLYGGLKYQSDNFGISFSIPVVGNNTNAISQAGGMMVPIGNSNNETGNMRGGSNGNNMMGGNMMGSGSFSGMNVGLGDLFLLSNYQFISEDDFLSDVILNAEIKIPTASAHMGIGTGKFDYGTSLTFRKSFDTYVAIVDLGYLNLGDPSGFTYENPFTYSFGIGKFFDYGKYSLLLYYSAYTEVAKGYEPPRQLSLGLNYKAAEKIYLTAIAGAGLSSFSPAYYFSAGLKFGI